MTASRHCWMQFSSAERVQRYSKMSKKRTKRTDNPTDTGEFNKSADASDEVSRGYDYDEDIEDELSDDDLPYGSLALKDDDLGDPRILEDEYLDDLDDLDEDHLYNESRAESFASADDSVRMYLKEIGQVPLLDTNRETWLSILSLIHISEPTRH